MEKTLLIGFMTALIANACLIWFGASWIALVGFENHCSSKAEKWNMRDVCAAVGPLSDVMSYPRTALNFSGV